jgi:hypothetical protein
MEETINMFYLPQNGIALEKGDKRPKWLYISSCFWSKNCRVWSYYVEYKVEFEGISIIWVYTSLNLEIWKASDDQVG